MSSLKAEIDALRQDLEKLKAQVNGNHQGGQHQRPVAGTHPTSATTTTEPKS